MSDNLFEMLVSRNIEPGLGKLISDTLNTDFTRTQMIGFLKNSRVVTDEIVVDEMLIILERRREYFARRRMEEAPIEDLFIKEAKFDMEIIKKEYADSYLNEIPVLQELDSISFESPITFFVGENGTGKSTILEAMAIVCGLNPEGGTQNYCFETYDDTSVLQRATKLIKSAYHPKWSYFLRAESFYNVATKGNEYEIIDRNKKRVDYHAMSHGESFLKFILDADKPGLYFIDEPEAALSPQRQLSLVIHLYKMAQKGAQFIIVSHSPILLGIPGADIINFGDKGISRIPYEETDSYIITKTFISNPMRMISELLNEDDEAGEGDESAETY